jgi:tetratricopeptide (TPR) repeat protein
LPAAPVLVLFAAWTLVDVAGAARSRAWRRMVPSLALFAVAFGAVNAGYPRFLRQRATHDVISYYTLAGARVERGDMDGALLELARARAAYERSPSRQYAAIAQDVYFKLGTLLYERGRCRESADALGKLLPHDPRAPAARVMFAECCEKTGRFAEAGKAYQMILRTAPDDERALAGLARCLEAVGDHDGAAKVRARLPSR